VHHHSPALAARHQSVKAAGEDQQRHVEIDFEADWPGLEQFRSVMEQLKDVPVHVHCIANCRVSAFFYRYRRDVLGMDEQQACAAMVAIWHPKGVWADFVRPTWPIGRVSVSSRELAFFDPTFIGPMSPSPPDHTGEARCLWLP
jgi:hypothetical protein